MISGGIAGRTGLIQSSFVVPPGSYDGAEFGWNSRETHHCYATGLRKENRVNDCDFELEKYNIRRWREEVGFAARAEVDIGETEEIRKETLKELRTLLEEQDEFIPRLEDDYLVRFLRAKKFDVDKAFRLLRQYYRCRLICPEKFCPIGLGPRDIKHLYDLRMGMLLPYRNPYDGTAIIVMQFGDWTPESGYDLMDTYTPVALAFDYVLQNPECQLNGFRIIFNFKGLELRYLKFLQPDVVRALMTCCQDGYPARFKGAHIVNNSYIYNIIWAFGKPFLNQKVRDRVQLHASDMSSLHEWISPEILPEDLGGKAGKLTHHWLMDEMYEHHDEFVKNSYYGYLQDKNGNSLDFTKERESATQVIS